MLISRQKIFFSFMSLQYLLVKPVVINDRNEVIIRAVHDYKIPRYLKHGWLPLEEYFESQIDIII